MTMLCDDQKCPLATFFCQQYIAHKTAPIVRVGAFVLNIEPKHRGCRVGKLLRFNPMLPDRSSPFDPWEIEIMPFGEIVTWENRAVVTFDPLSDEARHIRCTKETAFAT